MGKNRTVNNRNSYLLENKTNVPDTYYDAQKPFGADVPNKVHFGSRKELVKPNNFPAPGQYNHKGGE